MSHLRHLVLSQQSTHRHFGLGHSFTAIFFGSAQRCANPIMSQRAMARSMTQASKKATQFAAHSISSPRLSPTLACSAKRSLIAVPRYAPTKQTFSSVPRSRMAHISSEKIDTDTGRSNCKWINSKPVSDPVVNPDP